ncbi:hypothetical protein EEGS01_47740 (plasmid) [Escherichia coli]|nr:hypothetical protein EEGS01_47740 [Escherichia coli]
MVANISTSDINDVIKKSFLFFCRATKSFDVRNIRHITGINHNGPRCDPVA